MQMVYSFQLWKHPNIHYREALLRLSRCELISMLGALSIPAEISVESMGASVFLTFEARELTPDELRLLAMHSCVTLLCEKVGNLLKPLPVESGDAFPEDLPEILKYKGKTNPTFTRMMLNTALSMTSFFPHPEQPVVLDPLCGKATTLFCAACMGASALGLDADRRSLREAETYFSRYLKAAGIKHSLSSVNQTVGSQGVPGAVFRYALSRDEYKKGNTRFLALYAGDAALAGPLLRKNRADILVTDLPYGVQHAPTGPGGTESFHSFPDRLLSSWSEALNPGAALAVSFNSLTLKRKILMDLLSAHGFLVLDDPIRSGLSHTVEQAVVRDLIFAVRP